VLYRLGVPGQHYDKRGGFDLFQVCKHVKNLSDIGKVQCREVDVRVDVRIILEGRVGGTRFANTSMSRLC